MIPPLGHGRAMVLPDMPFLKWEYRDGSGNTIPRDNTRSFCDAAKAMFKAMKRYQTGDPAANVGNVPPDDMKRIRNLFLSIEEEDAEKRHQAWLKAIRDGQFSFGSETVRYQPRGKNSWKHKALDTSLDMEVHSYDRSFLKSNWKHFHDAIQAHRFYVNHDLLPRYGICAA